MDIFIGEDIKVNVNNKNLPISFIWNNKEFIIDKILYEERVVDLKIRWYQRKHKVIYIVLTRDGRKFEIYKIVGPGRKIWRLYKEVKPI